jgi:hypothetical protein
MENNLKDLMPNNSFYVFLKKEAQKQKQKLIIDACGVCPFNMCKSEKRFDVCQLDGKDIPDPNVIKDNCMMIEEEN